jgi:HPt (histidine-containing phosphotransfer) domain-containing protein
VDGRVPSNGGVAVLTHLVVDDEADAAGAGAMACLADPVEARILLDFLRSRTMGPAPQEEPADLDDVDAELMDRLHEMYLEALPTRLQAIAAGARAGNAPAVVSAAHTLAGTSGQFGHPEVASVCRAIAGDARRGIVAHIRLMELVSLCARVDRGRPTVADQATSR